MNMKLSSFLELGKNVVESNLGLTSHPYKLTLIVTYKCNSRCRTCNIWQKKSMDELSLKEIDEFFRGNPYFCWIDLSGGEIFLRPDIVDIARIIVKRCKRLHTLHFPTNGLMTSQIVKKVNEIRKLGINKIIITVSIDGPEKIHDDIRGVPGGYKKALSTFKELRKMKGLNVYAGMTLSDYNVDFFEASIKDLKKNLPGFTFKDLHVNIAHSSSHYYGTDNVEFPKQKVVNVIKGFMKQKGFSLLDPVSLLEYNYLKRVEKYLDTDRCPMSCHSLSASVFIDPNGNVYPCSSYNKVIGNIRNKNLKDILSKKENRKLAQDIRMLKCPQCWTPCEAYQTMLANLPKSIL